jgi:hypothetical protein
MRNMVMAAAIILTAVLASSAPLWAQTDPLPSWNEGAANKTITDFVGRVTAPGTADFVPAEARVATFDNDGTLWTEQPNYFQAMFALDRVKALPQHPGVEGAAAVQGGAR